MIRFSFAIAGGIALGLVGAAGAVVAVPRPAEIVRRAYPEALPPILGAWRAIADEPPADIGGDANAAAQLRRTYASGDRRVWVSVLYYARQAGRERMPAGELLYPHLGWTEQSIRLDGLPVDGGAKVSANLLVTRFDHQRYAVVYWYQVGSSTIASDHFYRALVMYNRIVHQRSDAALVRAIMPADGEGGMAAARDQISQFVRVFQPALAGTLPR